MRTTVHGMEYYEIFARRELGSALRWLGYLRAHPRDPLGCPRLAAGAADEGARYFRHVTRFRPWGSTLCRAPYIRRMANPNDKWMWDDWYWEGRYDRS